MRPISLVTAGATALALLAGGHAALATAPVPTSAPAAARATTIAIAAHQQSDANVDVGRKGFSAGDQEVSTMRLSVDGQPTGHGSIDCLAMRVSRASADQQCSGVLVLSGGTVTFAGATTAGRHGPAPFDWAVTGGTGDYSQATGYLHVVPANRTVRMTLNLL